MKARNFRYIRPRSLDHTYRILQNEGAEAIPVAGGQSLLPGLNMRLSAPKLLVDLGDLQELTSIAHTDREVRLGALTRHCDLLRSKIVREKLPLLKQAAAHIGHVAIRNRGTLGGSLAYADPAAELPACAVALGASFVLASLAGEREVKAEDFYKGLFETGLRPGELIVSVKFPAMPPKASAGFAELSRRHGDFALVGLAAVLTPADGQIGKATLVYFGCTDHAKMAQSVSAALEGVSLPLRDATRFAPALRQDLAPDDTPGLRADTRLQMAEALTRRVINALVQKAAA